MYGTQFLGTDNLWHTNGAGFPNKIEALRFALAQGGKARITLGSNYFEVLDKPNCSHGALREAWLKNNSGKHQVIFCTLCGEPLVI